MRIAFTFFMLLLLVLESGCSEESSIITSEPSIMNPGPPDPIRTLSIGTTTLDTVDARLATCAMQATALAADLANQPGRLPRSAGSGGIGNMRTVIYNDWTSGFFPGTLWYLYEATGDENLRVFAEIYTERVEPAKRQRGTHDLGFVIHNSFGNGRRLVNDPQQVQRYNEVILTASNTLAERFNPEIGLIRSWDFSANRWQYPVIIDNMMNLEMLLWAANNVPDTNFYLMATSHADRTLEEHFRPDHSSYHVVSYDVQSGQPHAKETFQGMNDQSLWARGQSWGLYGYTMMYRFTRNATYLEKALNIADLLMGHPNMPADLVPYWDYDASTSEDTPRDASAAALMASALIELSGYLTGPDAERYLIYAERQLNSLSSPDYLAAAGTNNNFILRHSVGHLPHNSEVDVAINYADYYYVEALVRMQRLLEE